MLARLCLLTPFMSKLFANLTCLFKFTYSPFIVCMKFDKYYLSWHAPTCQRIAIDEFRQERCQNHKLTNIKVLETKF